MLLVRKKRKIIIQSLLALSMIALYEVSLVPCKCLLDDV